ncbi:protein FYV8-like [Cocos nucifera]|uniref:Protein FYV8-like n=1 Tax=Cocos nucifera TaxID=13894 RepID=A0A8K0MZT6_COCNU|nr:protein FYV8-like [Cocos nucifera]
MLLQSNSRNQRSKGSKVKNIVQVTLLLALAIWLLYQIRRSHDKNNGYTENDGNELSNGAEDIHLGRKAKAGSENVIVIDNHVENFEETSETKEAGGGQDDALKQYPDDKGEEAIPNKGHEESLEDITDTETIGSKQEQQGSEDNNADSHINGGDKGAGNGTGEAIEEVIRLPSQKDTDDPFDQNGNRDGRDDSIEENVLPKDDHVVENFLLNGATSDNEEATSSDEEGLSTSQTETSEIAKLDSEHLEMGGELSDKAMPEAEGSSNSSLIEDQSNADVSTNDDFHKKVEVESEGTTAADAEISSRNEVGDAKTDVGSDEEHSGLSLPSEENDAVSINNETPERKIVEFQGDNTGAEKTEERDTRSEDEVTNSPDSAEDNIVVMPANKENPETEAVESQVNSIPEAVTDANSSEDAGTDTGSDDQLAKSSLASEQNNVVAESHGDKASHAEVTPENVHEQENSDSKSNDELANSSLASEEGNVDKPANGGATNVDADESQEGNANEAEINGNGSTEETKSETTSNNEAANSSDSSEQKSSETPNHVTPDGEAVESRDDNVDRAGNREPSDLKSESQIINVDEDEHNGNGSAEVTVIESISSNESVNSSHNNEQNSVVSER